MALIKPDGKTSCETLYLDAIRTYKYNVEADDKAISKEDDRLHHHLGQFIPVFVPSAIIEDEEQIAHYKRIYSKILQK